MSHQTHYRSYRGRFLWISWPNQQCQSTEGQHLVSAPGQGSIPAIWYTCMHKQTWVQYWTEVSLWNDRDYHIWRSTVIWHRVPDWRSTDIEFFCKQAVNY